MHAPLPDGLVSRVELQEKSSVTRQTLRARFDIALDPFIRFVCPGFVSVLFSSADMSIDSMV